MPFTCSYCKKQFIRKIYFDNHYSICQIKQLAHDTSESTKQTIDDLPTKRDMWLMIQQLSKRYITLEKKYIEIEKYVQKEKKKLNILDYLNKPSTLKPIISFTKWLERFEITSTDLQFMFKNGYVSGISNCIIRNYKTDELLPLCAFENKKNILYIFNQDNIWVPLNREIFKTHINKIHKSLSELFVIWQKKNEDKIFECDIYSKKYNNYCKIILGDDIDERIQIKRINNMIYEDINQESILV